MQKNKYILPLIFICVTSSIQTTVPINVQEFLPPIEQLSQSLVKHYRRILTMINRDKKDENRWLILKLLPTLGFNFITRTPTFEYNSNAIKKDISRSSSTKTAGLTKTVALTVNFAISV